MKVFYRKLKTAAVVSAALVLLAGCRKEPVCPGGPGCEPTEGSHTFLIYAVADNNLWRFIRGNVNMAMEAVEAGIPADTRVLVYWDGLTNYTGERKTALTEIVLENGQAVEKVLKEYDDQNSAAPAVMKTVLRDVQYYAPAEVYGISLLGHGTGWFPPELNNLKQPMSGEPCLEHDLRRPENALTRAYGPDGEEYMSVEGLVEGLSEIRFDYVVFDVCFMSSIELLYALRDNTPYILASPAEIMGKGIPYHKVLPLLFDRAYTIDRRLAFAASAIVDYYRGESTPSAAFTVVATGGLQGVADAVKKIFAAEVGEPDFGAIQYLEVVEPEHAFFDLKDYLKNITDSGSEEARRAFSEFETALATAVVAEYHTPEIYSALGNFSGGFFPADAVCGISSYIPRDWLPVTKEAWEATQWAEYVMP